MLVLYLHHQHLFTPPPLVPWSDPSSPLPPSLELFYLLVFLHLVLPVFLFLNIVFMSDASHSVLSDLAS